MVAAVEMDGRSSRAQFSFRRLGQQLTDPDVQSVSILARWISGETRAILCNARRSGQSEFVRAVGAQLPYI
jgi:hypothetical protein